MRVRALAEWFVILLLLLFLPAENRLILFDTNPEDWYGEVLIGDDTNTVIVAKNATKSQAVDSKTGPARRAAILQAGQKEGLFLHRLQAVLPESLAVIQVPQGVAGLEDRVVFMDDKYYFKPGRLSLMTRSDFYTSYLLIGGLLAGFLALGFAVARYGLEKDPKAKIED